MTPRLTQKRASAIRSALLLLSGGKSNGTPDSWIDPLLSARGWVAAFVWSCTSVVGRVKTRAAWSVMGIAESRAEAKEEERQRLEREREAAKWRGMSSDPLAQMRPVQPQPKQRDLVGPIVIGGLAVIASIMVMGWYSKSTQTTTVVTTSSIPKQQSTALEGLTPEQIELLKAKRDAMALPVAEPPHKKKKWAE